MRRRRWSPAWSLGCAVAVAALGASTAGAAFEWRAAWASPQTLDSIEALAGASEESVRVEFSTARPYCLRDLVTVGARARWRAWEMHAGELRGPDYLEWHLGLGCRFGLGLPARALLGARLFGVRAPGTTLPVRGALTALLRVTPADWGGLRLEVGIVDLGLARGPDQPSALLIVRLCAAGAGRSARLERSLTVGGPGETTLGIGYPLGRIRLAQALRLATGEGSLVVTLPAGPAEVSLVERWHPALGWTPAARVRW